LCISVLIFGFHVSEAPYRVSRFLIARVEGTFLVFSRTKHGADRISKKLERLGHDADVIHGDRSQSQRTAAPMWILLSPPSITSS
jgi:superfamily II DNA/RNA helicase